MKRALVPAVASITSAKSRKTAECTGAAAFAPLQGLFNLLEMTLFKSPRLQLDSAGVQSWSGMEW